MSNHHVANDAFSNYFYLIHLYNYHNITETKTKPDCDIFREYSKLHTGKIYRREGMYAKTKNNICQGF